MIFNPGDTVRIISSEWGSRLEIGDIGVIVECRLFVEADKERHSNYYYLVQVEGQKGRWFHRYDELEVY